MDIYNNFSRYLPVPNFQGFSAKVVSISTTIKNIALKILTKISQIPTKLSVRFAKAPDNSLHDLSEMLARASRCGDIHKVKTILATPQITNTHCGHALAFAAMNNHAEIVKTILTTVKMTQESFFRALAFAAMNNHAEIVKTILENNKEISTRDRSFALKLAYENFSEESIKSILISGPIFKDTYDLLHKYATRFNQTNILDFLKQQTKK
jgi:hypothetical protein